ncbi:hypothetical protein CsSME_00026181 [Camellia sinensis var. sinensis]
MDQQRSLCWATVLLVFTSLTYVYPTIYLVNAHHQPVVDYPIANLSTSWPNSPSSSDLSDGSFVFSPILLRGSIGAGFGCGFYCNVTYTNSACLFCNDTYTYSACLFAVVIIYNPYVEENYTQFNLELVWSANRNHPVKRNATLELTQDGDLILADANGTSVWSTNTVGGENSVSGLNLTEEGNLVLFARNKSTVWQSFDHPTDSLLLGQKLVPGQKLTARASESNWSQGLYSLAIHGDGLFAYVESNPPQSYYKSSLEGNSYVKFENGSFNGEVVPLASTHISQFMRLEDDGQLKVYGWRGGHWEVVLELMTSGFSECGHPMVCGKYSKCTNSQCSCLDETSSNETTDLGCSLVTPISCNYSEYHTLLELNNTSYFNLYTQDTFGYLDEKTELEDCKKSCLANCSCKAVLFSYDWGLGYGTLQGCLLLSEVFSLINNEGGLRKISVFLKVQKHPTAQYPSPTDSPQNKPRHVTFILGSSLGASFGVFFMIACCLFLFKKKQESEDLDEFSIIQVPGMPTRFSYEALRDMTSNFNNKLGEGGFGSVFQGTLGDGTKVAVKLLNGFCQVKKSFFAEVETIGSIHQVNLVRLIGFCAQKSHKLLVYEYMPNGSLDKWIFQRNQELILGWQSRRKIIMDIAKGLAYLHEECRQKIFHLDIKPQNILLDENFNAKISDFGLSKLIDKDQSQVVTTMRGTPGYLAPEWLSSIITEKVDVYSFGVVVLEMLCGRKNLDRSQPEEDMHLLSLFKRKVEEERLIDIVDNNNDEMQLHGAEVVEMMRVVVWCLQSDFSKRPSMSLVVKVLEGSVDVENNLDYNFINPVIPRTIAGAGHQEGAIGAASTLLFPSALSGPR